VSLIVRATDEAGLWAETSVVLEVANANDAPAFGPGGLAALTATEGTPLTGTVSGTASDPDAGDALHYSKSSGPDWLMVATDGSLSGTPLAADAGSNLFTLRVTDSGELWAEANLMIEVTGLNLDTNDNGISDAWEIEKFGSAPEDTHPATGDEDGDGLSNLLEFALDTHPAEGNSNPLASSFVEVENGPVLQLSIPKNPSAENLVYVVEVCDDPVHGTWSAAPTVVVSETATQLVVRDTQPMNSTSSRFIRLRVSVAPSPP
jgi:hypothetical protein